jgi:hypothetical protein
VCEPTVTLSIKVVSRIDEFTSKTLEVPEWFRSLSIRLALLTIRFESILTQAEGSHLPDDMTNVLIAVVDNTSEQISAIQICLLKIIPNNRFSKLKRVSNAWKTLAKEDKYSVH